MAFFIDPDGGVFVDTDRDNCARTITRNANRKVETETITTARGRVYRKTYLYDANGDYSGETKWVRV